MILPLQSYLLAGGGLPVYFVPIVNMLPDQSTTT
jgi:hypothetical protein